MSLKLSDRHRPDPSESTLSPMLLYYVNSKNLDIALENREENPKFAEIVFLTL
jgi:hypothetical protein